MNPQRRFSTALNLHLAAVAVLLGAVLFLGTKALIAVHEAGAAQTASFEQEQIRYAQLQAQLAHLQGLPEKVEQARGDAIAFYAKRIAPNYSTVATELGELEVKNQVRMTRASYTGVPAIDGLLEVRIDANLSGDYAPLMHFINDLEGDKNHVFFIINGITLTGQQGGLVSLRLRMTTYLQASATDVPSGSGDDSNGTVSDFVSSGEVR
jgi:type IV pilus assembly protein PilO